MDISNQNIPAVLDLYPIKIIKIIPECIRNNRGVWWIETNKGLKVLKMLSISQNRIFFILEAVNYLSGNKINIPPINLTTTGKQYVILGNKYYLLFDAIKGNKINYTKKDDLKIIITELANFHLASTGFNPPEEVYSTSLLGNWPSIYKTNLKFLQKKYQEVEKYKNYSKTQSIFIKIIPLYLDRIKSLQNHLNESAYLAWVNKTKKTGGLGHLDFNRNNTILAHNEKLYILDLDYLQLALPAQDIRDLICHITRFIQRLPDDFIENFINWYHHINPLSKREWQVVKINLLFPYRLIFNIKNFYFSNNLTEDLKVKSFYNALKVEETIYSAVSREFDKIINQLPI